MKFGLKNDGGIELHMNKGERKLINKILKYCENHSEEIGMGEEVELMREIMNVCDDGEKA